MAGRNIGRVEKANNVAQGGAVGMVLYNPTLADTETDNHFLPTVHLADGTALLAYVGAHPAGLTARFTPGAKVDGQADVMAAFSSRGPNGRFLKPDIAGHGKAIDIARDFCQLVARTLQVGYDDAPRAGLRISARHRFADAARRSRDDANLAFDVHA